MFTFRIKYFLFALLLFVVEVLIALFINDDLIRPYGGDFLAVILLYCLVRSFFVISKEKAGILVLVFAYCLEFLQYFKLINLLGLQHNRVASVMVGTAFEPRDLVAYTLGILFVFALEKRIALAQTQKS